MNYSDIVKANAKGQIVIPKEVRETLHITKDTLLKLVARGEGLYIYPVSTVITGADNDEAYARTLALTRGAWGPASKEDKKREVLRKKMELAAAKRRRDAW